MMKLYVDHKTFSFSRVLDMISSKVFHLHFRLEWAILVGADINCTNY